jgi:hypothetical protein
VIEHGSDGSSSRFRFIGDGGSAVPIAGSVVTNGPSFALPAGRMMPGGNA